MIVKQIIYCPNCGDRAERYNCSENNIMRTSCSHCDYLMVQCSRTGKLIEAYTPIMNSKNRGFKPINLKQDIKISVATSK